MLACPNGQFAVFYKHLLLVVGYIVYPTLHSSQTVANTEQLVQLIGQFSQTRTVLGPVPVGQTDRHWPL